jgi:histidyl-tRNA synthetase
MFPANLVKMSADVMVAALGDEYVNDALTVARQLRASGMSVLLYPQPTDKLQKQLSYASGQNIALVVLSGEHERANGTVLIKDMKERSQKWIARETATDVIKDMLSVPKGPLEIEGESRESVLEH